MTDPRQPVPLRSFWNVIEARIAVSVLEEQGIQAFVSNENTLTNAWHLANAMHGVVISVAEEDIERANQILDDSLAQHADADAASDPPDSTEIEPAEGAGEDGSEESEDDVEILDLSPRELAADQALKYAMFGMFIPPLQIAVIPMLIETMTSTGTLRFRYGLKAIIAMGMSVTYLWVLWMVVQAYRK